MYADGATKIDMFTSFIVMNTKNYYEALNQNVTSLLSYRNEKRTCMADPLAG